MTLKVEKGRGSFGNNSSRTTTTLGRPWCVGGDFNAVIVPWERTSGQHLSGEMEDFIDFIEEVALINIFTWSITRADRTCSRLDRILVSMKWEDHSPYVQPFYLARTMSNHKPILLKPSHSQEGGKASGLRDTGSKKGISWTLSGESRMFSGKRSHPWLDWLEN